MDNGRLMPVELERSIYGFVTIKALYLLSKYDAFSYIMARGSAGPQEISAAIHVNEDTLERLLLVLGAAGVLARTEDGSYSVVPATAPFLDRTSEFYLGQFVEHLAVTSADRLGSLESYLISGQPENEVEQPFDVFYGTDESALAFTEAMWDLSFGSSQEIVASAELGPVKCLVDVGGASGPFAIAALRAWPDLRAVIFDLPSVKSAATKKSQEYGLQDRLSFVAGDFFNDELPSGDCIAFGYILSDWKDDVALELLEKAFRACTSAGSVFVMDRLFDEDRRGPMSTAVMNLIMHLEMRGRHRNANEYVRLVESAGFVDCEVRRFRGEKHLIVGHKP